MTKEQPQAPTEGSASAEKPKRPSYEPNPKHKEPWQRGARGTLCPPDINPVRLLAQSKVDPGVGSDQPGRRFATDGHRAYCAHEHAPGRWHGFPVEWRKVPPVLRNNWLASGRVKKRSVRELW